jgi:alanine racemase
MFEPTAIEINELAYKRNLEVLQDLHGDNVVFSSVVKGNAYGHGIETFVPMAERCGVRHFSVFSADEAWRVSRCLQVPRPIMIMGMIDDNELA